jgi:hypothetical protein
MYILSIYKREKKAIFTEFFHYRSIIRGIKLTFGAGEE